MRKDLTKQADNEALYALGDHLRAMAKAAGDRPSKQDTAARVGISTAHLRRIERGKEWVRPQDPKEDGN
jgi:hypothetical protein